MVGMFGTSFKKMDCVRKAIDAKIVYLFTEWRIKTFYNTHYANLTLARYTR